MKKMKKKSKKNRDQSQLLARKGITLVTILAVLILIVNIITASFSWFTPLDGKRMEYSGVYNFRSENCTMTTHVGSVYTYSAPGNTDHSTGYIVYENAASSGTVNVPRHGTKYFRTIIQNSNQVLYPSDISLYIADFPANFSIGVSNPSNSFRTYTTAQEDLHIVRNAYVKVYVSTDIDPGILNVDWFVINNTNSDTNIDLSGLYMVYN